MLVNLLSNTSCTSHYRLHGGASDQQLILVILDKGVGITEEEIQLVFGAFFRASNRQLVERYGIGLPLARNSIPLLNGTLAVPLNVNVDTAV